LWRKSNNSGDTDCVEVALNLLRVGVRDTKDRETSPVLTFTRDAWTSFLGGLRTGAFGMYEEHRT
jgi:hypothetical protein